MPMNLFLKEDEVRNVAEWESTSSTIDKSLTTKTLSPLYNKLVKYIPATVAPNLISITGLICVLQAYYTVSVTKDTYPRLGAFLAGIFIFMYQTLDGVVGRHATNTMNNSSIGELFDSACNAISAPFVVVTLCRSYGYYDRVSIWFLVHFILVTMLKWHVKAFLDKQHMVRFGLFGGPGKALIIAELGLIVRALFGLEWIEMYYMKLLRITMKLFEELVHRCGVSEYRCQSDITTDEQLWSWLPKLLYYLSLLSLMIRLFFANSVIKYTDSETGKETGEVLKTLPTKFYLLLVLIYQALPSLLLWLPDSYTAITEIDLLTDGVLMSVLICDVILAKMARRNIHYLIPILYMISVFDRIIILFIVLVYFGAVFGDLCVHMNLPLLTVNVNVYCDGVYDMCHAGHKRLFRNALKFGTRLYVGVVGDNDANSYKRPPIMNMSERVVEVLGCKSVHKVIKDCPCFGLTKEFITQHKIHVVAHGREYTALEQAEEYRKEADEAEKDGLGIETVGKLREKAALEQAKADKNYKALSVRGSKYYKVAFDMGITEILPRTPGMSTSDLIKRCQAAASSSKRKDK